ncbi:MAG: cation transporter [Gammaproteobacteria bacterium]|nr:cation transporter [Gammaproteobacteria bacterium]
MTNNHHNHHGHNKNTSRRALLGALVLNGAFLLIEAGVGFWSGSLALLSDAAHMVSDVAALALALLAAHLALYTATPQRTFGFLRAEVLGAFINAVALLAVCVFIFKEAIERLIAGPPPVPGIPVLAVGVIGLLINLGSAWFLWRSSKDNLNVRGALAHMLADALGSIGVILAALLNIFAGWVSADALISLCIGVLILLGTWGILRDSAKVLLDFAPAGFDREKIGNALQETEGVSNVHDLHVWTHNGGQVTVTAHLVPAPNSEPFDVLRKAEQVLHDRLGVVHSTLQIEPENGHPCRQTSCPLFAHNH